MVLLSSMTPSMIEVHLLPLYVAQPGLNTDKWHTKMEQGIQQKRPSVQATCESGMRKQSPKIQHVVVSGSDEKIEVEVMNIAEKTNCSSNMREQNEKTVCRQALPGIQQTRPITQAMCESSMRQSPLQA
jgi:hypothetical protein